MLWILASASALTLDDAWRAAESKSHEAAIIEETRLQSDQLGTQAWAAVSPKLSLNGNWTLNQRETALDFANSFPQDMLDMIEQFTGEPVDFGDPVIINKKSYFDWNVSIVQPVFSGKAFPGLIGAKQMVKAGRAQEDASMAQLKLGVAQAWWGAVVAREGEKVATASVEVAKKHVATAQSLVSVGSATRQTELQAKIALARAERDLAGAQSKRIQAEEGLAALTGISGGDYEAPALREFPYSSLDEAEKLALDRRPEIQSAEHQAKAAAAARTASQLGWLPDVNARFTEAFTQNEGFSGEPYTWMFTLGASWTLWDGGYRIADNTKSASQARLAEEALEKAQADTLVSLRGAWQDRLRAVKALDTAREELGLAEENLRLADASFAAGASSVLDTEDARVGRDAAQMSVITERMNLDVATLRVLLLLGDL